MIGGFPYIVLHQFRPGGQFGLGTVDLRHSPTAVSNITCSYLPSSIVLDFLCDFPEMSMMLHHCHETQFIECGCPILQPVLDDPAIIRSRSGIGATRVYGVMVISKAIEIGVILTV